MKSRLNELTWDGTRTYADFKRDFNERCDAFNGLKDADGNSEKMLPASRSEKLQSLFTDTQASLPPEQRTWLMLFNAEDRACERDGTTLTLETLDSVIRPLVESAGKQEGRVQQQTWRGNLKPATADLQCINCGDLGHYARDCANTPKVGGVVCRKYKQGHCK